ncbi:MAG TPA: response regulator [Treponemataceae bacterium]|nr:response regulator [Treponemataceae bacterium]
MYSVFLVDDEVVVREGIRNSIPWDETEYTLVGEAPDGEMALAILKDIKPDILITDIRMPFLDGLALARIVKKTQPWIKIIILSGHDEFSYAQEAISIGVEEYLLKPVSSGSMLECLHKVAGRLDEEKKQRNDAENLKRRVMSSNDIMKEKWLCDLVSGAASTSSAMEQAREFDVDIVSQVYAVAIAELCCEKTNSTELERAKSIIESLASASEGILCFSSGVDTITFIIKGKDGDTVEESAYSLAQGIKYETERNTNSLISVGIGSSVNRIGLLPQSWSNAKSALKYLSATGRNMIAGVNDIHPVTDSTHTDFGADPVAVRLRHATEQDIDCIVEQYSGILNESGARQGTIAYYLLYDIIVAARKLALEFGGSHRDLFPEDLQPGDVSALADSPESFRAEVRRILERIVALRTAREGSGHDSVIQRAKRYIQEHFADPDISLNTVAAEVNYSPNHFSTVFSQESGETFIEYLTWTRITRAKQLLASTSLRSSEVAYEVGYNDPHYFSFLFKKNTGKSPREFRTETPPGGE